MKDPYDILGIAKDADDKSVQAAYRKLAKKYHPDLNPGNREAEETFKDVSAAYDLLGDADKRKRFDAGEIDASGAERPEHQYYRSYGDSDAGSKYYAQEGFSNAEDLEDFLANAFGGTGGFGSGSGGSGFRARGSDVSYSLRISFMEAAQGASKRIGMPDGKTLDVKIPEGTENLQTLRLSGQGNPGFGGGPNGDAYIEVHVAPHAYFERKDDNIHVELPVTLKEAVLGGKIDVPTVHGPVSMTIPKGSNTGTTLRLKDKGLKSRRGGTGHQYVRLKVVLPSETDSALEAFLEDWDEPTGYDPRKDMGS